MGSSTSPSSIDGVLDIVLHHATDIHNICIYGNQDVYAKFSITHTQDAVYSTQPIRGGGKNPVFNQNLQIFISKLQTVLKCEIWMMSCARTYLEDQLLGFVLIPLCDLFGQGRVTKDYSMSSTELFHTPAGTICLSLTFYLRGTDIPLYAGLPDTSTQDSLEDNGNHDSMSDNTHDTAMDTNQCRTPMEYNNIEFPDLQAASENQHLVSVYLNMASGTDANMDEDACGKDDRHDGIRRHGYERDFSGALFLQLGSSPMTEYDSEMGIHNGEEKSCEGRWAPTHDSVLQEDVNISSRDTPTVLKAKEVLFLDSKSTLSAVELPIHSAQESINTQATPSPTSTMLGEGLSSPDVKVGSSSKGQDSQSSFAAPLVSISLEPEEPVVQQQIVDMYMKSMQQFTESLAKMKLPLDLDNADSHVELKNESPVEKEDPKTDPATKDIHKVFYGSRAFF